MIQNIIYVNDNYDNVISFLKESNGKKIFLVCGEYAKKLEIGKVFLEMPNVIRFSDFEPNPSYESIEKGVKLFQKSNCDMIVALGGGSSIDVAKCIKLYAKMKGNFLEQKIIPNDIPLVAIPTTAGTGSEATKFAVIYYQGEKKSIEDESILPSTVIFDSNSLTSLPYYQRCSTMLDAFCHAIESYWCVNSTDESKKYSKEALTLIMENKGAYLNNTQEGNTKMLLAANLAGRAINITHTTAGHAMCYKLTSLYKISHGHAAFLCLIKLYSFMLNHLDKCIDKRGEEYLKKVFDEIKKMFNCSKQEEVIRKLEDLKDSLNLPKIKAKKEDYEILCKSVNVERLLNNPVKLDVNDIDLLYHEILKED